MNGDHTLPVYDDLTSREREVLDLMTRGLTNGEIAERLDISFGTAKNHVSAIISKLGVDTREEAVRAWKDEQRLGARFTRMMRGLAGGIGMWKVAAGGVGVAAVGVVAGIGVALSDVGTGTTVEPVAVNATPTPEICDWDGRLAPLNPVLTACPEREVHMFTVRHDSVAIEAGLLQTSDGWLTYERRISTDPRQPWGGVTLGGPLDSPRLVSQFGQSRPGYVAGSTALEADHVRIVFTDGTSRKVELVAGPAEFEPGWSFWGAFVDEPSAFAGVELVDRDGAVIDRSGSLGSASSRNSHMGRPALPELIPTPTP